MKKFLAFLLVLALAGGSFWYVRKDQAAGGKPAAAAGDKLSARAEKRDIDFTVEISGDVTPVLQLEVKAEVGGKLRALHVEAGATVKEGDLLVEIDDRDLLTERANALTEIDGAKLAVDKDRRNFERGKELFESKLISREIFDNLASDFAIAENSYTKAERKLQIVDDKLSKTKVLAPMDSIVLTVPVTEGQVVIAAASVNSGTSLMTIANLSKLRVVSQINQIDVARLELNQPVKLRAESLKDADLQATITFIAPVASVKNGVKGFEVQALIEKSDPRLRPGMTVNISVPIAKADDAVTVPIAAVFKGEGRSKVVYVRTGETTEKRAVKIGVTNIDYAQILTGVVEGEEILLVEPDRAPAKKS